VLVQTCGVRNSGRVVSLGVDEVERAAGVLARAFAADPLTLYLLPDDAERARKAPLMFTVLARYDYLFGQVDRFAGFEAVATWLRPEHGTETPERLRAAGFDQLHEQIGAAPVERLEAFYAVVEEAHWGVVADPHWYLRLLGVEPTQQGLGLGGALLQYGLARADANGDPCFLETFQERNVPFYLRNQFQLVIDDVEPTSGIRFWSFLRHPSE
jgi:GNAT superfamily N-acetyltransferase